MPTVVANDGGLANLDLPLLLELEAANLAELRIG
jgi:hypothetical protein